MATDGLSLSLAHTPPRTASRSALTRSASCCSPSCGPRPGRDAHGGRLADRWPLARDRALTEGAHSHSLCAHVTARPPRRVLPLDRPLSLLSTPFFPSTNPLQGE
jgi:hypothetical protein